MNQKVLLQNVLTCTSIANVNDVCLFDDKRLTLQNTSPPGGKYRTPPEGGRRSIACRTASVSSVRSSPAAPHSLTSITPHGITGRCIGAGFGMHFSRQVESRQESAPTRRLFRSRDVCRSPQVTRYIPAYQSQMRAELPLQIRTRRGGRPRSNERGDNWQALTTQVSAVAF